MTLTECLLHVSRLQNALRWLKYKMRGRSVRTENRTVLCGYILDDIIRGRRLIEWNARIAERLPAWFASDWTFELEPAGVPSGAAGRRGRWARFRKRLDERRWGIA